MFVNTGPVILTNQSKKRRARRSNEEEPLVMPSMDFETPINNAEGKHEVYGYHHLIRDDLERRLPFSHDDRYEDFYEQFDDDDDDGYDEDGDDLNHLPLPR